MSPKSSLFFDAKDHEILNVVNRFLNRDALVPQEEPAHFFHPSLHPHGIKELAISQEIRVAYAVINLLDTLEIGQVHERIEALRALHDEVLYSASSSFRYNTGRVLIQIMKSLIRAHGNPAEQLRLAHDFRRAASGRRRVIREMLRRFYLLEMPEEWNQLAFDNHVHDANTKGRKSPTHLIMDAWIKGIRKLDVVYYNFVEHSAVAELLQAAEIMGITVRVGVEFLAKFRDRYVQFIWQPYGFANYHDMLAFMEEKPTRHLMRMGREASQYHHDYVMLLLQKYNDRLRFDIGGKYGVELTKISKEEILSFVGIGQTSRTHLAELIFRRIRAAFAEQFDALQAEYQNADPERKKALRGLTAQINELSTEGIINTWLSEAKTPDIPLPHLTDEMQDVPEILRLLPTTLIDWLTSIRSPCNIVLNLCCLSVEDVLELLYECEGMITHLELFNLKNYHAGKMDDIEAISELQTAINEGSAIALKRLIRNLIKEIGCSGTTEAPERCRIFTEILRNIPKLQGYYTTTPLKTRIGSDSTSRSSRLHGMGFIMPDTLPGRARKVLFKEPDSQRRMVPLSQEVYSCTCYYRRRHLPLGKPLTRFLRKIPGLKYLGMRREEDWHVDEKTVHYCKEGNIATLGGFQRNVAMEFHLEQEQTAKEDTHPFTYMNTTVKNVLKVLFGFALTVVTFQYTQTWWFLAWLGPIIWFAITGFRNILQATLGGGGIRRTPLLGWNAYLSWSRLCDSLMFTGISVPLLELGVRWLFLEQVCRLDPIDSPTLFYSIMSLVNGAYIAAHNIYRGLPREAVVGNIFRSFIAIPVSVFYSFLAYETLVLFDLLVYTPILQQSASVIAKLASDSVAAVVEGLADKAEYLRMRHWDYRAKLSHLFNCVSRLEILLPDEDIIELLHRPKDFIKTVGKETEDLEKSIIVNALDLMYFWMYQPRARSTLARLITTMTEEERAIFVNAQLVLTRVQEVSQMLVDGLAGINFAKPLAFYLARHEQYLDDMSRLTGINLRQHAA